MALPVVDTNQPEVKKLISAGVKDIANMIFKSASVSVTAAAKAVVPSIPDMVAEITEDLRAGPVNRFSQGLDKLDKLLMNFGANIKDYSKELANFVNQREEKINKSEKIVRELREKNVKAEVNRFGEVKILSRFEIEKREKQLKLADEAIKKEKEKIARNQKLVQEEKGNTKERRDAIVNSQETIIKKEQEREKILESLNKTEEDTSDEAKMTIRERANNFVDEYVPDGLRDIGSAFTEGLMAPITAVKELGLGFMSMLKPLKALPKLFKGFIAGMMGAIIAFIPFLLKAALVIGAIVLLKKAFDFLKEKVEENKEKLIEFKDKIVAIPQQVKDFFDEKFTALGEAFNTFVEDVKAIPGKISDFFQGIFNKIQNFFIDLINGAIDLLNKVPGVDMEKFENIPMPEKGPVDSPVITDTGSPLIESAKNAKSVDTKFATNELSVVPGVNAGTNQASVVVGGSNVSTNNTVSLGTSSKNNDYSRLSLYADGSP